MLNNMLYSHGLRKKDFETLYSTQLAFNICLSFFKRNDANDDVNGELNSYMTFQSY